MLSLVLGLCKLRDIYGTRCCSVEYSYSVLVNDLTPENVLVRQGGSNLSLTSSPDTCRKYKVSLSAEIRSPPLNFLLEGTSYFVCIKTLKTFYHGIAYNF